MRLAFLLALLSASLTALGSLAAESSLAAHPGAASAPRVYHYAVSSPSAEIIITGASAPGVETGGSGRREVTSSVSGFGVAAKGAARAEGALSAGVAGTFKGDQYTTRTLDEDLVLYRRWGGESGELGPYWSRTNYARAGNARRYSALPPGNTAEHITTIRVPAGTRIHEGRAAAQADWGVPGGGSQVVFDEGFRVPGSWVQP